MSKIEGRKGEYLLKIVTKNADLQTNIRVRSDFSQ